MVSPGAYLSALQQPKISESDTDHRHIYVQLCNLDA